MGYFIYSPQWFHVSVLVGSICVPGTAGAGDAEMGEVGPGPQNRGSIGNSPETVSEDTEWGPLRTDVGGPVSSPGRPLNVGVGPVDRQEPTAEQWVHSW